MNEWQMVMDNYKNLTEWAQNGIRNIARHQLQELMEGTGQGISSSDTSHRIFAIMQETDGGDMGKIIELAKEHGLL
jgi:hypothetical protein